MSPRRNPDAPLERSAYLLLSKLAEAGPLTIRSIADAFALDDSTVNRQTAATTRAGLTKRIADPDGGIARKFTITEAGREQLLRYREWARAGLARVLGDWPAADVAELADLLERLNDSIQAVHSARHGTETR